MKRVFYWIVFIRLAIPAAAQQADLSIVAGGGFSAGEEQQTHGISAVGFSFGFPYSGRYRIQFDYVFNDVHARGAENRHFATGSYIMQSVRGRIRPFFQAGAGVVRRTFSRLEIPGARKASDVGFAAVFGGGATIDLWESVFIRAEARVYGHVGPTLAVAPCVAVGYRF